MDELAEAAGVSKPVLYQHFGSKRDLYLELLEDVGARLLEDIAKATAAASGPRQQVEAGFAAYFRFVSDRESAFRLLFGGARSSRPTTRERVGDQAFADAVRRVEDAIAEAIAALIDADIDTDHRRLLAYAVVGLAEGTGRFWLRGSRRDRPEVLARRIADLTWAGLRGVHR
jgi:AcrR family transcriptional regulator